MSNQPEALRMAEVLERGNYNHEDATKAASELRRLHNVNHELLEALKNINKEFKKHGRHHWPEALKARAAIAKATGEQA